MRRLSSIILSVLITALVFGQKSPHGEGFSLSCEDCHNSEGWKVDLKTLTFNHGATKFSLVGQHREVGCRQCHTTLEFKQTGMECIDCHTDMHNQTVGPDCGRCHTPVSWVVNNITEMHQRGRFPLVGAHVTADCFDCHTDAKSNFLQFGPLGVECIDCHRTDYNGATSPNHAQSGYSTNCVECHNMSSFTWSGGGINHNFFPLELGHEGVNCQECHKNPDYSSVSPECASCHQTDYNSTSNPNHGALGFSTTCSSCHTLDPGWKPAEYKDHDAKSFPIYSGEHNGEWSSCTDCHKNPSNYADFTCIDCHEHNQQDMDDEHNGLTGYAYNSQACFGCHPTGQKEGIDHNLIFPLTGAHTTTECIKCHANGYTGTPTLCNGCHTPEFNQTINPNHATTGIPTDCGSCHTTDPGWKPAQFPNHNEIYLITGAHVAIASNCVDCHNGNYNETPSTCEGCHMPAYNSTTNPSHTSAQFPITCLDCHSQTAWSPSTWDHDAKYFPIYSGKHQGEWNSCVECHTNPANYAVFSCIDCHEHAQASMNSEHLGVVGYAYNSPACLACHPRGEKVGIDHNLVFPLTGAHSTTECIKCHANGYSGTPTLCNGCHTPDFNQALNPNHGALGLSTDCASCHTTNPGWEPAMFPNHNTYYLITGAHIAIANSCTDCHNGNYTATPNTCEGCHLPEYNQTTNPSHTAAQFPTTCLDCHSQNTWSPANWNHDSQYFPIYSGKHNGEWNTCADCHTNPANYAIFSCIDCHEHTQSAMQSQHQGVAGYAYNSIACLNCHPQGSGDKMMIQKSFKNE